MPSGGKTRAISPSIHRQVDHLHQPREDNASSSASTPPPAPLADRRSVSVPYPFCERSARALSLGFDPYRPDSGNSAYELRCRQDSYRNPIMKTVRLGCALLLLSAGCRQTGTNRRSEKGRSRSLGEWCFRFAKIVPKNPVVDFTVITEMNCGGRKVLRRHRETRSTTRRLGNLSPAGPGAPAGEKSPTWPS